MPSMAAIPTSSSSYTVPPSMRDVAPGDSDVAPQSQFAFAQVKGNICLVQVPSVAPAGMSSALMASDVNIFRHEFITQFRYSHSTTVHPADLHILEPIDARCTLYEADKGTVFLARDVMDRLHKLTQHMQRPTLVPAHYRRRTSLMARMH